MNHHFRGHYRRIRVISMFIALTAATSAGAQNNSGTSASDPGPTAPSLAHRIEAQIIVLDAETAAWQLADWAEDTGGYFTRVSTNGVMFRIPTDALTDLRPRIDEIADAVLRYEPRAWDTREELAIVETGISSREDSLELILSYIDESDVTGTLDLEQEVASLITQIESLKGRRRRLLNDARFAQVAIYLGSRQQTIPEQIPSSFGWINTMGLYRFIDEAMPYGY